MYRVVLVDDEPLILAGIASLVDWEAEDCTLVGKATNGSSGVSMIMELRPDIVITDIRMPVLNGLEMVAKCQSCGCSFSFIVLTNLEEFDLAKQAIILGATDYLVKLDLSSEELLQSLGRAKESCDLLAHQKNHAFSAPPVEDKEKQIRSFFHSYLFTEDFSYENSLSWETAYANPFIIIFSICQDVVIFDTDYSGAQLISSNYVNQQVYDIITSIAKRSFQNSVTLLEYDKNSYLLISSLNTPISYHTQITQFCTKLQNSLKNYFEYSAVYGVSTLKTDFFHIREAFQEAQTALEYFYYDSSDNLLFYNGQSIHHRKTKNFNINFLKKDLAISIQKNDSEQLYSIFSQIIELFRECKPNKEHATSACINIYTYLFSFFETDDNSYEDIFPYAINIAEQLNRFYSLADILEWLKRFADKLSKLLNDRKNTKSDKLIEHAIKFIEEHYTEKIGLAEVSVSLNISPGYLSSNFKKYTNTTLSDYIATVKIDHAKKIIDTHQYLIYEISDMLGFDNPYYFSKVFKKVTGISPKEYEMR